MKTLSAALMAAALVGLVVRSAHAAEEELKIGVVAAESGSFVSAGNTIVAAAKLASQPAKEIHGAQNLTARRLPRATGKSSVNQPRDHHAHQADHRAG